VLSRERKKLKGENVALYIPPQSLIGAPQTDVVCGGGVTDDFCTAMDSTFSISSYQ
jgi:hypothetical protein